MTMLTSEPLFSWIFYQVKNIGYLHKIWWKKMFCAKKVTKLPDLTVTVTLCLGWIVMSNVWKYQRQVASATIILKIFLLFQPKNLAVGRKICYCSHYVIHLKVLLFSRHCIVQNELRLTGKFLIVIKNGSLFAFVNTFQRVTDYLVQQLQKFFEPF
jgi:hypothetical protein